jgi:small subunit ribosomal protein S9
MAEEPETPQDEQAPADQAPEQPEPAAEEPAGEEPAAEEEPAGEEPPAEEEPATEAPPAEEEPAAEAPPAEEPAAEEPAAEQPVAEEPAPEVPAAAEQPAADAPAKPKPEIPGADLDVDIVPEGMDPLASPEEAAAAEAALAEAEETGAPVGEERAEEARPVAQAAIDLAAGARYTATGKRKSAIARVILQPGKGEYVINGRSLDVHFPRPTLQKNIRQPLETVGYESRMDVVATLHGGGVSAQAGALRHGISRALIEADPNLRSELKRRGFLTRDPRVKERKKAGLKKARKRPQFSKR